MEVLQVNSSDDFEELIKITEKILRNEWKGTLKAPSSGVNGLKMAESNFGVGTVETISFAGNIVSLPILTLFSTSHP